MNPKRSLSLVLGAALILAGLVCILWSVWPLPQRTASLALTPDQLAAPGNSGSLEGRALNLVYPAQLRLGQAGQVWLDLVPEPADGVRSATVNVEAEAWLELPGATVLPGDVTSAAVLPGRTNRFQWQVLPEASQSLEGRAWLYFRLLPADGSADQRVPISAQPLKIQVLSLFGLDQAAARWVGILTALVGIALAGWGRVWGKARGMRRSHPEESNKNLHRK